MKYLIKLLLFSFIIIGMGMSVSCKRCATCIYDDLAADQDTSNFCGQGKSYQDQLNQHEKNGYVCVED